MTYLTHFPSPVGKITAAGDGAALTGLWIEGQKHFAAGLDAPAIDAPDDPVLLSARAWLERYFRGECPDPRSIPLAPKGTAFQRAVWDILCQIPYGQTLSYGQIAEKSGNRSAVRAVGNAVGRNPIAIIIPCHRVLGADGSLTGYAGGIEKKIALLTLEGIAYK